MVLAAKIFAIKESSDIDNMIIKLRDHQTTEVFEEDSKRFDLVTEIKDLRTEGDSYTGIFSSDEIIHIPHHGEQIPIPRTITAPFILNRVDDNNLLLTVLEKKRRANQVANTLSKIVFLTSGHIVEARILPERLQKFHEENFDDTKIIFFDDVDLPNINKLSLYGSVLGNTGLYNDYLTHGKIWYTVIKSKKYGYIVGLTRNCVVTVFSKIEEPDFVNFIQKEVFPLITSS